MVLAAGPSKAVVLLLSNYCSLSLPLFGIFAVHSDLSSLAITSLRKRELFALLILSSFCYVTVSVLCIFLMVHFVVLQCVIVGFISHTHSLFDFSVLKRFHLLKHFLISKNASQD